MLFDKGAFKYYIGTFRGGGLSQNADAGYAGRGRDVTLLMKRIGPKFGKMC